MPFMIGVFDSGLGGLSVLAAIARALPQADLTYFADAAHIPYGSKSDEFIRGRVLAIGDHLVAAGCQIVVVACNTATAAALNALRERHPGIPVVGVEPGIKPAAIASKNRRIAVLATESTARSERLARLIRDHADSIQVHVEPCPGWATRVETLNLDDPQFTAEIAAKILPLLEQGADQLVLGCTHYSFLAPTIKPLVAARAELVDVADAVARQVARLYGARHDGGARLQLLSSAANPERLALALVELGLERLSQRAGKAQLRRL